MLRRRALLILTPLALLGPAACSSSDGRTLPPPPSRQTTTPVSSPVVGQPSEIEGEGVEVFALFSHAFEDGEPIPAIYTCAGENLSPPLDWASTPAAAELAIVVRDRDAAGYLHWVVTGIDPLLTGFGEGGMPEGAVEGVNDSGTLGWSGPCPPPGAAHRYEFTVHALAVQLTLDPTATGAETALLVEGASTARATVTATFQR